MKTKDKKRLIYLLKVWTKDAHKWGRGYINNPELVALAQQVVEIDEKEGIALPRATALLAQLRYAYNSTHPQAQLFESPTRSPYSR